MADNAAQQAIALLQNARDVEGERLAELAAQRKELQKERSRVNQDLKNEKKRQKRVLDKARSLDDAQLLGIIITRAAKAKAKAKAKGGE